jgi:sugar phosphate isomerase/epimerase
MKLAFSTLGCPRWDMGTIIARAVEYGFDGVDFRAYLGRVNLHEMPEFTSGVGETARRLAGAGLEVSCLSGSAHAFCATARDLENAVGDVRRYGRICRDLSSPFIRVFGGGIGKVSRAEAIDTTAGNLARMSAAAKEFGARVLIETHDDWVGADHLRSVMQKVPPNSAGIVWDTHHTCRMAGQAPAETWKAIGTWVRNTHWKDSLPDPKGARAGRLCLFGDGDIPLRDIFRCLETNGYSGYLTLEWEKMWHPDLAEPEIAFPRFVEVVRGWMAG